MTKPLNTMTVGELKAMLNKLPGHMDKLPVGFTYPSGDHWRTELIGTIRRTDKVTVEYTGYHEGFKLVEADDAEGPTQEIIILK